MPPNHLIYRDYLTGKLSSEQLPEEAFNLIAAGMKHDYLFELAALYKPAKEDIDMDKLRFALEIPDDFIEP